MYGWMCNNQYLHVKAYAQIKLRFVSVIDFRDKGIGIS